MGLIIHFLKNPISFFRYLSLGGRYRYSLKNLLKHKISDASRIAKNIVKGDSLELNFVYKGQKISMRNEIGAVYYMTEGIKKLDKLVAKIDLPENATVIDAGGNVGLFSMFLLQRFPNTKIILIEPSSDLQGILKKNLSDFSSEVTVIKKALTDKNGFTKFFINKNAEQTNSVDYASVTPFIQSENDIKTVEVETVNLETVIIDCNLHRIDLLKLDIQGGEYPVLKSSHHIFSKINKLLVEVSFISEDNVQLCGFITNYYPKTQIMGEVKMGADILFKKEEKTIANQA